MASELFESSWKRIFREHKGAIVRLALNGYKNKGRGFVLIELTNAGSMEHLSYLTLEKLKHRDLSVSPHDRDRRVMLIEKISTYYPGSEILVMVTDGEYERFSVGSRQVTQ